MDAEITDADVLDTLEYYALEPVAPLSASSATTSSVQIETSPRFPATATATAGTSTQRQELAYLRAKVCELELELRRTEQANGAQLEHRRLALTPRGAATERRAPEGAGRERAALRAAQSAAA